MDEKLLKEHYETNFSITFQRPLKEAAVKKGKAAKKPDAKSAMASAFAGAMPAKEESKI
jgi:hypothetical protein